MSFTDSSEALYSRGALARRWGVCKKTIERYEARGRLKAIRLNSRIIRYRLSDIIQAEKEAQA